MNELLSLAFELFSANTILAGGSLGSGTGRGFLGHGGIDLSEASKGGSKKTLQ